MITLDVDEMISFRVRAVNQSGVSYKGSLGETS